jgi:hypothetical protein
MVFYVGLIAILNLSLGYALAVYLGADRAQLASNIGESLEPLDDFDAPDAE